VEAAVTPTWEMVEAEQRECATLFRSVTGDEWHVETLCAGWSVRDMLTHIAAAVTTDPPHTLRTIRLRNDIPLMNQTVIDAWKGRDPGRLIVKLERHKVPSLGQRVLGTGYALRAMLIHQQDVRRPLVRPRQLDPDRARAVLDGILGDAGGNIGSVERAKGLRVVADDIDWAHGEGPEVHGSAEPLIMALAGRPSALGELAGPGLTELASRFST
jgi:uncharacterized protein (TIGR03083 family)